MSQVHEIFDDANNKANTIVEKYGNPNLFITMSFNPYWTKTDLTPRLVNDTFEKNLKTLLDDLKNGIPFGAIKAYFYTIEFQKNGRPHAHILVILKDKWTTPGQVNNYICAEIPDKNTDSEFYETFKNLSTMIHICDANPKCGEGKCGSFDPYPKKFKCPTEICDGGYHRCCHSPSIEIKGKSYGSSYVVAYNRELLLKFNTGINVELVVSQEYATNVIKYIHKGPGSVNDHPEIEGDWKKRFPMSGHYTDPEND